MSNASSNATVSNASSNATVSDASRISPVPTEEEAVAIVAAVEALWPQVVVVEEAPPVSPNRWRFSGRWWAGPIPRSRQRP